MAKLISAINNSGLYAQYAASAEKDSLGRVITATYLTAVPAEYATDEEVATVVANGMNELSATVSSNYYPLNENPAGYLVNNDITGKLDKDDFDAWSAGLDFDTYSAGTNINITNHVISGKDWTDEITATANSAYTAATAYTTGAIEDLNTSSTYWNDSYDWVSANSADNASKTWVNEQIANLGSFATANSASTAPVGHPDVNDPNEKTIYLTQTKDTGTDKWMEWIVTGTTPNTGWECIGDTSMDLSNYVDTATYDAFTATADVTEYTAANNYINVNNHGISGYDWTSTIEAASGNAVTTVEGKFELNNSNEISSYNGTAFATPDLSDYITETDLSTTLAGYVTTADNYSLSSNVATLTAASATWNTVTGKLDTTAAEETYQTIADMTNYYEKTETSGAQEISDALSAKQDTLTFTYATIGE